MVDLNFFLPLVIIFLLVHVVGCLFVCVFKAIVLISKRKRFAGWLRENLCDLC
jgi:uncharacterized integral membrane protein